MADQSAAPGTKLERGTFVTITVSRSMYEMTVPTVTGVPLTEAQDILSSAGLVVSEIETQPSEAANMIVIQQIPDAGTNANRGDAVKLIVSGGIVVMPNLQGMTREQAEQTILAYGLTVTSTFDEVVSDPALVGVVTSQAPAMYSEVLPGSAVTFTIGRPSPSLLTASVLLETEKMTDGGTVTVSILAPDGSESLQYTGVYDAENDAPIIVLYRDEPGEATYIVRFNVEEISRGTTVFGEGE